MPEERFTKMSDNLFSKDRIVKTALCTTLAAAFHASIYGWMFNAVTPGTTALMITDALVAGAAFFVFGWGLTNLNEHNHSDLADCGLGFSTLLMLLFGGTIVALSAGALTSMLTHSHFALLDGAWKRIGLSGLWLFASMFTMALINNVTPRKPIRAARQKRSGGDFRIAAWGRL
jgi:hypothetical protein